MGKLRQEIISTKTQLISGGGEEQNSDPHSSSPEFYILMSTATGKINLYKSGIIIDPFNSGR